MTLQSSLTWNIFHNISLSFITLTFLKNIFFPLLHFINIESSSFWNCLMFSHDQIQVTHFLPVYYMDDNVFSGFHMWSPMIFMCLLIGDVNFDHIIIVLSNSFMIQLYKGHTYTSINMYKCIYVYAYIYILINHKFKQIHFIPIHSQSVYTAFFCPYLYFPSKTKSTHLLMC